MRYSIQMCTALLQDCEWGPNPPFQKSYFPFDREPYSDSISVRIADGHIQNRTKCERLFPTINTVALMETSTRKQKNLLALREFFEHLCAHSSMRIKNSTINCLGTHAHVLVHSSTNEEKYEATTQPDAVVLYDDLYVRRSSIMKQSDLVQASQYFLVCGS
jgi:hypothetical protein